MKQILLEIPINSEEKFLQLPQIHILSLVQQIKIKKKKKQNQQKSKMPQYKMQNYKTMQ